MLFQNKDFQPLQGETVLDCLLRNDIKVDFSCKSGNCQSCLLKSLQGDIDQIAQKGLKPTLAAQGFFMACQQNASVIGEAATIATEQLYSHARLVNKQLLSQDICQLILEPVCSLFYHAGQFINLKNPQGIVRSYSIASNPADDALIELHVQRKSLGVMSDWIFNQFNIGDGIDFQGPIGDCFYSTTNNLCPIVLIGTSTGAAPLIGIIRDALGSGHSGEIIFYHGAKSVDGLYLHQKLIEMEEKYSNFSYQPSISSEENIDITSMGKNIRKGRCNEIALTEILPTKETLVFLCGNPEMVKATRKKAFLAGFASKNIFIDPFEYQELRKESR